MPALNFQSQFADQVRNLEKRQTIRARGKRRPPRVGEPLMLYTGMRQVGCRKLLDAVCTSVEPISICPWSKDVVMPRYFGGDPVWSYLSADEIAALAKADGFPNADSFFAWFAEHHGDTFSGYVIQW